MIVRTYGRRNRGIARSYSDSAFDDVTDQSYGDSLSQESSQDMYGLTISSQDSSHWSFEPSEPFGESKNLMAGVGRRTKKVRNGRGKNCRPVVPPRVATTTLMETQEFGEMMEHEDEVNFALDGLRKGQPVRIRRASLLSLLSICATAQQRRLLRAQGMAKKIIDSIVGLNLDDLPSNLAASALFYVLTSDSQDDHILDSPSCIRFLLKLLKPITSHSFEDKVPAFGSKLLALRKDVDILHDTAKKLDSSSAAIVVKVQKILVSCKGLKASDVNVNEVDRPELSPKWIALLTMEKASLSTISLEDTSGTIRKTGGNFKETLRELGGLDAVFNVAMNCHSILEGWLEHSSSLSQDSKDNAGLQSLVLLLKCLKIMENATFLSKENQSHLLGMKGSLDHQGSPLSFTELIINVIKILSGLSLNKSSSISSEEKSCDLPNGTGHTSDMVLMVDYRAKNSDTFSKSISTEGTSSGKSLDICQSGPLSCLQSAYPVSSSETTTASMADTCLLRMRVNSSTSGSCCGTSKSSNSERQVNNNGLRKSFVLGKRPIVSEETEIVLLDDCQDPFAFDEDDFEPSKWDLLSGKQKASKKSRMKYREHDDGIESQLVISQQESCNGENHYSQQMSCSAVIDKEKSNLLADCLLTAVKVLMNLTNDNPIGCQLIAAFGGLETMSSLIACHFPLFSSPSSLFSETQEYDLFSQSSFELDHQCDVHLSDQELDFLVAILGLLVNLVEKDSRNRSQLAEASVSLPSPEGSDVECRRDVIPLLCSIFWANRGAGEAAGEGKLLPWNDEAAVLQGEREAEKMIIEAYAALLLAFLSTESKSIRNAITDCLPEHNLAILVPVLERFVAFHLTLNMISPETHIAVSEVIESCRVP